MGMIITPPWATIRRDEQLKTDRAFTARSMPKARDSVVRVMDHFGKDDPDKQTTMYLRQATLMWVTAEMSRYVWGRCSGAVDLADVVTEGTQAPEAGLVGIEGFGLSAPWSHSVNYLDEYAGLYGRDACYMPICAIGWVLGDNIAEPGTIGCEFYFRPTDDLRRFLRARHPFWSRAYMAPVSDVFFDDPAWVADFKRFLFTMWQVASEERTSDVTRLSAIPRTDGTLPRRVRDRDDVRIISLRRTAPAGVEHPGTGKPWDYRTVVKRHRRTYWTGPGRAVPVKRVIEEYIAGPEDAPLRTSAERVYALRH